MAPTNTADRFPELLRLLDEATDRGRLVWEATPEDNEYRAVLGTGMVRLTCHGNPSCPYSLTVLDRWNQVIGQLIPEGKGERDRLQALFGKACRQAPGLDTAFEAVLDELRRRVSG